MQLKTTLATLEEMQFSSPYLIVMNKSETIVDKTAFPYDSVSISAKEELGIDTLKREILRKFKDELLFCTLFVPYANIGEYAALKPFLTERTSSFTDDGQTIDCVIPTRYADKFSKFIIKRTQI